MYRIVLEKDKLNVLHGKRIILKGIAPVIYLEDDDVLKAEVKTAEGSPVSSSEEMIYTYEYLVKEKEIYFTIEFRCRRDFMYTSIQFNHKSEMVGGRNLCIKSVGGIRLEVESLPGIQGLMANYLHKDWWTRPSFEREISKLPTRTQSLLWKDEEEFNYLLPVCGDMFKSELCGCGSGMEIQLSPYDGGYSNFKALIFLLGTGKNPFEVSAGLVEQGLKLLGSGGKTRENRRYPDMLEYFGWCSWDAFYYEINEKGIMEKAEEFKRLGVPAKWFIVDAGWSDAVDYHLNDFTPDKDKFPEGFRGMIEKLKEEYCLDWVGVWHTLIGYWNGIYGEGPLAKELSGCLYKTNAGKLIPYPEAAKAFEFWNKWHSYLKNEGVDFVKVDYQSVLINMLKNNISIGKASKEAHEALEASVGKNFDNRMINCMGMASENLWHRPMSPISRNSDDFFPKEKDSFKEHALQNAYNSFYTSNFIWGDWDMWWTNHEQAVNNAVLRAVSGGPVYVSDPVGTTDVEKLLPVMLKDGRILRCDQNGLPTLDCLLVNPQEEPVPLKIWNKVGDSYVLSAFNINVKEEAVEGSISLSDIPECKGDSYLVYEHFTGEVRILRWENKWDFKLKNNELFLYSLVPVENSFTPVGLLDKYISRAAVEFFHADEESMIVKLKEGGRFGFAAITLPERVLVNGKEAAVARGKGLFIIDCSGEKGSVLIEVGKG